MPSQPDLAKAFAMFDRNSDGLLSLDELKAILCRPTPGHAPLSEAKVEEIMKECDTNGDGQLSMEELAAGWADLRIEALLASAKAPPPSFAALVAAGTVVPDECDGPYALGSYHANVTGGHQGYKAKAGWNEWHATNKAIMALQTSWTTIDFEAENTADPEYMFTYGAINGEGVNMSQLRSVVIEAQKGMKTGYCRAFESARGKPGAAEVYERIAALPEKIAKVRQPGGEQLDLIGLYKGALLALGEMWEYGQQAIAASARPTCSSDLNPKLQPTTPRDLTRSPSPHCPNPPLAASQVYITLSTLMRCGSGSNCTPSIPLANSGGRVPRQGAATAALTVRRRTPHYGRKLCDRARRALLVCARFRPAAKH
eukprot:scaffold94603_cov105-Phaeocystis_antarctica.AAC.1